MGRQRANQRRVAEILGKSQPQVSARLLGEIAFNTAELDLLAEAWGVPVTTFLPAPERVA
jgi:transcriptional regulator with XRE-family HTH domain